MESVTRQGKKGREKSVRDTLLVWECVLGREREKEREKVREEDITLEKIRSC